jgi:hypothetical protein
VSDKPLTDDQINEQVLLIETMMGVEKKRCECCPVVDERHTAVTERDTAIERADATEAKRVFAQTGLEQAGSEIKTLRIRVAELEAEVERLRVEVVRTASGEEVVIVPKKSEVAPHVPMKIVEDDTAPFGFTTEVDHGALDGEGE